MTTIPTTLLIIGSIIFFMLGGFVGVIIMSLMNIAKEAINTLGRMRRKKNELYPNDLAGDGKREFLVRHLDCRNDSSSAYDS